MPVRLRLQRHGRRKNPFYVIVAADSRVKRDGKYIERIGSYNPTTVPAVIELDNDAALKWLYNGAEPTNTVRAILSYKGVLYKKHLYRGVSKGSFSQEEADKMWNEWMESREKKILDKKEEASIAKRAEFEKVEAAAREKREKERAEKAAKPLVSDEDTKRAKGEDTEAENVATDIDAVAKQAAAERGEVVEENTPVSEELTDNDPAAANAVDAAENSEEFKETEAQKIAEEATEEPAAEATEETKAETTEEAPKAKATADTEEEAPKAEAATETESESPKAEAAEEETKAEASKEDKKEEENKEEKK